MKTLLVHPFSCFHCSIILNRGSLQMWKFFKFTTTSKRVYISITFPRFQLGICTSGVPTLASIKSLKEKKKWNAQFMAVFCSTCFSLYLINDCKKTSVNALKIQYYLLNFASSSQAFSCFLLRFAKLVHL